MTYRVLVVEDTEPTRYLQSTWLRRAGYDVTEATTGAEALAMVGLDTDVVVLDIHLPDMTGFDVCVAIKSTPATAAVPVMHVSATAIDVRSRSEGLNRGADAYLVEPVDRGEYLATVQSLARVHSARRSALRLAAQLSRLASATLPVNAADSVARLLEAAAQGAADVFSAPALAVAETEAGLAVRALSAGQGHPSVSQTFGGPLSKEWTGAALYVEGADLPPPWPEMLSREGIPSRRWFIWPARKEGRSSSDSPSPCRKRRPPWTPRRNRSSDNLSNRSPSRSATFEPSPRSTARRWLCRAHCCPIGSQRSTDCRSQPATTHPANSSPSGETSTTPSSFPPDTSPSSSATSRATRSRQRS